MSYDKKKLENFKSSIFEDIKLKTANIKHDIYAYEKKELDDAKQQALDEIFQYMQGRIKDLKDSYEYKLTEKKFEIKKYILSFRNSLVKDIVESCEKNIIDFAKSEKYIEYMLNKIRNVLCEQNLVGVEISVKNGDLAFKEDILKIEKVKEVSVDVNNVLGGFKLIDRKSKIEIDETFETLLHYSIKNFYMNCELMLENNLK